MLITDHFFSFSFYALRFTQMKKYIPYLPALFMDLCIGSALVNTSFYSSHLGLSTTFIGIISAVRAGLFVCFAVPFGRASDRYGRTRLLYISTLLFVIVSLVISRCKSAFSLALVFPLTGIIQALFWPVYEAWIADRHGEGSLQRRIRFFNVSWSIGIMLGTFIPGHLYRLNPLLPFYSTSIVSLCNFVIIWSQNKTFGSQSTIRRQEDNSKIYNELTTKEIDKPPKDVKINPVHLNIAWIANFSSWFTLGILRSLSPKMAIEIGIKADTFSNLMLLLGISQTFMFFYLGTKSSQKLHYRLFPLLSFQALASLALLLIWKFYNIQIWAVAFFLIGITTGMTYFSSMYYGLHGNLDKGVKSGLHEAILGSGTLLGPLVGGIAADKFGVQSPYFLCCMLYLVSIIGGVTVRLR